MAIDPATVKLAAKAVVTVATNEKVRNAVLITVLIPVILLLLILSSPMAIFCSVSSNNGTPITETTNQLHQKLIEKVEKEIQDAAVDAVTLEVIGSEDNSILNNSTDVLLIFSAKYNGSENKDEVDQVVNLSQEQITKLTSLFWKMNTIEIDIELIEEEVDATYTDNNGEQQVKTFIDSHGIEHVEKTTITKSIKHIIVDSLTADEMALKEQFNDEQLTILYELKDMAPMFGWTNDYEKTKNIAALEAVDLSDFNTIANLNWFDQIQYLIPRGVEFSVLDIATGKSFNVWRTGGIYHADVEPLTTQDTIIIQSLAGFSWNRRAVVVCYDGNMYPASIHTMPHSYNRISTNSMQGHICVHFKGSWTHIRSEPDTRHQQCVKDATKFLE